MFDTIKQPTPRKHKPRPSHVNRHNADSDVTLCTLPTLDMLSLSYDGLRPVSSHPSAVRRTAAAAAAAAAARPKLLRGVPAVRGVWGRDAGDAAGDTDGDDSDSRSRLVPRDDKWRRSSFTVHRADALLPALLRLPLLPDRRRASYAV